MWSSYLLPVLAGLLVAISAKINVAKQQEQFNKHPQDISFLSLFYGTRTFKQHNSALFKGMDAKGLNKLLSDRPKFVSSFMVDDMAVISEKDTEMCRLLSRFAADITPKASSGMSFECIFQLSKSPLVKMHHWADPARMKLLPDRVFKAGGGASFSLFQNALHRLSENQIRAALCEENAATSININWLRKMNNKQLGVFTADHYSMMSGWNDKDLDVTLIGRLPDYAFAKIEFSLNGPIFSNMTKGQVEKFGFCQSLRPDLLSRSALQGLKSSCFKSYIDGLYSGQDRTRELGRMIVFADEYLLSSLDEEGVTMIHANDWTHFSGEQLQHLPATSCGGITKDAQPENNMNFIPTPVCFAKLHSRHQLAFLQRRLYELPTSILQHVDLEAVEAWPEKMNTLLRFRLPGSMIQQLGAKIEKQEQHPCAIFTCIGCINKVPNIMANMGISCAKAVANRLPQDADVLRSIYSGAHIAPSTIKPTVLQVTHKTTLKSLFKEADFCAKLEYVDFESLRREWKSLPSGCVKEFCFLDQLNKEIHLLPNDAFSEFDISKFASISDPLKLALAQFHLLGSKLPDEPRNNHPINSFKVENVSSIPLNYIAQFSDKHLSSMDPALIAALTTEQIQSLPAKAFRRLPIEQFKALRIEDCTLEQIENLGVGLTDPVVYPLSDSQISRLGEKAKVIMMKNTRLTSGAANTIPKWPIGLAAVCFIVMLI